MSRKTITKIFYKFCAVFEQKIIVLQMIENVVLKIMCSGCQTVRSLESWRCQLITCHSRPRARRVFVWRPSDTAYKCKSHYTAPKNYNESNM